MIEDHFWILFMDPDHDLSVVYPGFLKLYSDKLRMPTEEGSVLHVFSALTDEYREAAVEYYKARQDYYASLNYAGLGYESIWKGNRAADAPVLTVYRHFESGSVHRGLLGNLPKTVWVIDYPLLERVYYGLVAGFDVYGTVGHQLAVRHYMDALRVEGESYFLDFLPPERRQEMMQSWNLGVDLKKIYYEPSALPDFFDLLAHFDKSPKDLERLARYGVNRAEERLWETYDWFQQRLNEDDPVRGGLLDLNRYYYNAR